jgi:hypothetical protein
LKALVHGKRSSYIRGCRCRPCKDAHAAYRRGQREGLPRVLVKVSAEKARAHLEVLTKDGASATLISKLSGVHSMAILRVLRGEQTLVLESTEKRLLAVGHAESALVCSKPTRALIGRMRARGFTLMHIARLLGYSSATRALYVASRERMLASTAAAVERLWRRIEAGTVHPERAFHSSCNERKWLERQLEAGIPPSWLDARVGHAVSKTLEYIGEVDATTIDERRALWPGYDLKRQPGVKKEAA